MLDPGTQVGRYEIQRRLGRGGMGAVYVAHDPLLGRMVAIKVFSGELDLPEAHERFSREARAAAALNHPNIVTIHDYGEYLSQPYIVMEYVPGETLGQMIRRKASASLLDKLRWMEELCTGAGYAHQMSMIHRDIKPSNLIIDRSGRLKILDFGIARVIGTASNTTGVVGTPGYMAPEQILDGHVDHRADLFSIGVVCYELLGYAEAFPGDTIASITHRIVTADPAPLRSVAPDAPPEVIAVVERLLRKVPADRFSDAESVRTAVSRIRRGLESDSHPVIAPTILRPPRVTPPGGMSREGLPAHQRPSGPVAGPQTTPAPTPTPGPRKTDREALARRRDEQLKAALERARAALAQNDLERAFDACQQALTFDEQHAEALELEEAIHGALAERDARLGVAARAAAYDVLPEVPVFGSGRSSVSREDTPSEHGIQGSDGVTIVGSGQEMVAPTAVGAPIVAPVPARPRGNSDRVGVSDLDVTRLAPRRTPTPRPSPQRPLVARQLPVRRIRSRVQQLTATVLSRVRAFRAVDVGLLVSRYSVRQWKVIAGAVLGAIAAAAAIAFFATASVRPEPVGTLIVDAVPWGTITSIQLQDGERLDLPPQTATPFWVSLPPGDYAVVVTGPPPQSQEQRLAVRIDSGATNVIPAVRFHVITPEEYFESYLTASSAAGQPGPGAADPGDSSQAVLSSPSSSAPAGRLP